MPFYRVYTVTRQGHIETPAEVLECGPEQLTQLVREVREGDAIEVWDGAQCVAKRERE